MNIRSKGAGAEREIADMMNAVLLRVAKARGIANLDSTAMVQRNTLQAAIGGCDLTNTGKFAIEVKRHESLSINTWWKQCEASAIREKKEPVLMYRQNRKPWKVVSWAEVDGIKVRAEYDIEGFLKIWELEAERML